MELEILQILALCMQAREKGHDCFFNYSPHVNVIEVTIYKNGWYKGKDYTKTISCSLYTNDANEYDAAIETTIDYLTNLIKEEDNE